MKGQEERTALRLPGGAQGAGCPTGIPWPVNAGICAVLPRHSPGGVRFSRLHLTSFAMSGGEGQRGGERADIWCGCAGQRQLSSADGVSRRGSVIPCLHLRLTEGRLCHKINGIKRGPTQYRY